MLYFATPQDIQHVALLKTAQQQQMFSDLQNTHSFPFSLQKKKKSVGILERAS